MKYEKIYSPRALKSNLVLGDREKEFIDKSRKTAASLFARSDKRFLIVAGPCSLHDIDQTREYARRFKELSDRVSSHCFLVMRAYVEKSRSHLGWRGLLYDPVLDESADIARGIFLARQLLLELTAMEVPLAVEFLSPLTAPYFEDLITWGFIGARTTSSQIHRHLASLLTMPVGFKNSVDGNIDLAIHSVQVALKPHRFLHPDEDGQLAIVTSRGNPHAHIVHRGSLISGNADTRSVQESLEKLHLLELPSRILIDCSHGNSQKRTERQCEVFRAAVAQYSANPNILGCMLESNLLSGAQEIDLSCRALQWGVSVTDPCIGWEETEELILSAFQFSSTISSPLTSMSLTQS